MKGYLYRIASFSLTFICLMVLENGVYASQVAMVASSGSGEVVFINIESAQVIGTLKLGYPFPHRIAVTPDGGKAIIAHSQGYISFIDPAAMAGLNTLELLRGPEEMHTTPISNEFHDVAITPDGATAIVTEGNEWGQLFFFVMATMAQSGSTLYVGDENRRVKIRSDGTKAYVLDEGTIHSIRLSDRVNEGVLCFQPTGENETSKFDLLPDNTRAIMVGPDNWVFLIDMSTCSLLDSVNMNESVHLGTADVVVSPDGATAIVTNFEYQGITFVSIGATSLTVLETIDVGGGAYGVAFTPDGQKAVVTISDKSLVAIVDVATREVIATISEGLGLAPSGVVIVDMAQVPSDPTCECDLNADGRCDMLDWFQFGQDWGRTDCPLCP